MAALIKNCFLQNFSKFVIRPSLSRLSSSKKAKSDEEVDLDKPIKYSTSKAATWKAEHSFSGSTTEDVTPWYQPLVITGSIAVFLIYFAILREENDIDAQLGLSLYDRIDGLEAVQLKTTIKYYKENDPSHDTRAMESRLANIEAKK